MTDKFKETVQVNHDFIFLLQTRLRMAEEDSARLRYEIERERDDRYVNLCEKYHSLMSLMIMAENGFRKISEFSMEPEAVMAKEYLAAIENFKNGEEK